jgi:hypothetical protein
VSVIGALLSVPVTYATIRAYDVLTRREPNAARIVWTPHIAMFWRLNVGAYVAGMVAMLTYVAATRDLARTVRALSVAVVVAAAMSAIQGLFMP